MGMTSRPSTVTTEQIERSIHFIRGHRVMLAPDLALLFGVATRRLNEQVKRNVDRFPPDFMFQLSVQELRDLKSQIATSSWGGTRTLPYAFTEHGTVMLANVLNSPTAVTASIEVVRAFVRMRQMVVAHKELARKIEALERKYDGQFEVVFEAIRELMAPPEPRKKGRIGF
jgi:hypothetical protein